ncbi:hormogonium polysaccharide biosynthesis protein HpsL [Umezakia ovalisporum]|uniref:Hormogonium polysaccharide biosynthesis protein HpsL n=2 Tax=Umezakia ovalisporum TaxID=75695 RepID=A0AA43GVU8_9CYAN|nr:hormogonium polysaccharide biosynthesis protein HpsL [Umezakia ovalisporum]MDH6055285.1 hormogonium polysaccharide biosynthesis protein HpsL [Umezakia ovalisporum FSS-43]MDH6062590.1 hormogonium polysaccharide biosynthesis protein HpsL [Umezakia ovalisporum FSS-62]MDH6066378.1 hormogonium polysaccharide biosynthesis protein HpsL [Umezakia ovalisporum APH033B]MDH6071220.1 hormogonium polysaccharide biosynthesis protein HpsL [Umezakia ovalisporum CobakiLakeA]MDH6073776.1 hormogonium polysacch
MPKLKSKSQKSKKSKKQDTKETSTLSLKENLAQKRKATQGRKKFTTLLTAAGFTSVLFGILLFLVGGIKVAAPGILAILIISFSYKYPRSALYAFLIYMPFGGTITYYISNSPILQLAKDSFYVPALIACWQTCRKQRLPFILPKDIKTPLFILLGFCLLTLIFINGGQQLNPPTVALMEKQSNEMPLAMGLLGLKVLLGYIPLITCAYYLIRNKKDFLFLSRLQVAIILICCTLGIIQYILLLTGVCEGTRNASGIDLFKATLDARCYFGGSLLYSPNQGVIRLPGTFVAPWQWAWFLISSTFFAFATGFTDPAIIWRLLSLGSLATVFINAVISGQRIALGLVPLCFVILLIVTGQIRNFKRFIPMGLGLVLILGIAMVANPEIVEERTNSFIGRVEAAPPQEFVLQQFEENLRNVASPIGSGLGRATNSARALGRTKLVETYYPKVIWEIGIVGVLGFLALVTTLTISAFKAYRAIKDPSLRIYAASLWLFILLISYNTYYYPLDVDPVAVYYWFCAGVLFKLPVLDQEKHVSEPVATTKKKSATIKGQNFNWFYSHRRHNKTRNKNFSRQFHNQTAS